jgi:hypothetical protein
VASFAKPCANESPIFALPYRGAGRRPLAVERVTLRLRAKASGRLRTMHLYCCRCASSVGAAAQYVNNTKSRRFRCTSSRTGLAFKDSRKCHRDCCREHSSLIFREESILLQGASVRRVSRDATLAITLVSLSIRALGRRDCTHDPASVRSYRPAGRCAGLQTNDGSPRSGASGRKSCGHKV